MLQLLSSRLGNKALSILLSISKSIIITMSDKQNIYAVKCSLLDSCTTLLQTHNYNNSPQARVPSDDVCDCFNINLISCERYSIYC